ncbi:methyltransferase domain-containing protein [Microcoleus sp. PH2017_30_WIL_O_A]|uniref:class I SAM-dependent methyltransferase n=1 Tax=Microcoleus sp. PH2017_30_WIL_O_A TaxID=2798840 RepID=UPI001E0A9F27|nr:methyltransferase domain-containing protein [Microcoleus sp. PH2017_30_WIL_O_A]MCC3586223.1 methyltransferase domain-containing protein [Microcoleus sp. PH2017_30_WIL_O_A]
MTAYHESIIDQFTRQAVPFSNLYGHTNQESLDLLMKMASVSDKDTVLDVACGPGIVACAFAAVSSRVTGIDLTPAMLEQAQILAEQKNLTNLSWLQGDIETLPFPDDSFSIVLSRYAFHHFLQPDVVLSEMVRVCRAGDRILIADVAMPPEKVDAYNYIEKLRDPSHTRALTLEELPKLVADANLQNVKLAFYKVELELEQQLAASFPNPGDDDKLRQLFREDIGVDSLGIGVHFRGDAIHYAVPIAAIVGEKAKLYSNPK